MKFGHVKVPQLRFSPQHQNCIAVLFHLPQYDFANPYSSRLLILLQSWLFLTNYASDDHIENIKNWETMFGFVLSGRLWEVCVFVNGSSSWTPCLLSDAGYYHLAFEPGGTVIKEMFLSFFMTNLPIYIRIKTCII